MPRLPDRRRFIPGPPDRLEARALRSTLGISSIRGEVAATTDLVYTHRQGLARKLNLALPSGQAPDGGWPVVLAFPGAGWRAVRRERLTPEVAEFTRLGYALAVVDVAYAGTRAGSRIWPLNFEDARDAVRWMRTNAATYGVNPGQIVAFGESAGANLSLLLGSYPDGKARLDQPASSDIPPEATVSARVQAVVDLYGPADLVPLFRQPKAREKLLTFLGGSPVRYPGRYAAASPITYVSPRSAPTFIVQGTADTTVPLDQSTRLAAAFRSAGVAHRLVTLEGYGHGFQPERGGLDLIPQIVVFLDSVLPGRSPSP